MLEFVPAGEPVRSPVTKLGGQPVWLGDAQWPISRDSGTPMWFIAQFVIPALGGDKAQSLAYLFMTNADSTVDYAAESEGGENAVIIQPHGQLPVLQRSYREEPTAITIASAEEGPTIGPDHLSIETPNAVIEETPSQFIGGSPQWLQGDETPVPGWTFLAQLDASLLPLHVDFGDDGVGYIFLSPDRTQGRFLWQCH